MPWYFPWSESIKKRACRYLLQHYLGQFLQEKLTLDQLSVDLYNGTGTICDLNLDVISLNKCLDGLNIPIEIVDGFVKSINAAIPWSTLTSDNTVMEITGLELTIQPHESSSEMGMSLDSMFASMTTSMQLAQECLRQDVEGEILAETAQPMEGLELFAQTIESVLSRIRVTLVDTVIRIEHIPQNSEKGVALEIRIKRIEYFDDQANTDVNVAQPGVRSVYEPAAICYKNFRLMGVTFYADRFPESQRSSYLRESMIASVKTNPSGASFIEQHPDPEESELIQIATLTGRQEMKVKIKQCDAVPGPKIEVNLHIGSIHSILTPKYVHILINLCKGFETKESTNDSFEPKTVNKPMGSFDFERVENELQKQFRDTHRAQIATNMLRTDMYEDEELEDSFISEGMYYSMHQNQYEQSEMTSSTTSMGSSASGCTSTTNTSIVYNYGPGGYQHRDSPFQAQKRKPKQKSNVQKLLDDPGAELTRYKIKLSFLSLLLLHEDPPDTPSDGIEAGEPGYEKLKKMVDAYLSKVVSIPVHGSDTALEELRPRFAQACSHDHISLLSKPITIECEFKASSSGRKKSTLTMDLSIGLAEIVETLYERNFGFKKQSSQKFEHTELLVFQMPTNLQDFPSLQNQNTPCLKLSLLDYQTQGRDRPVTDISVQMAPLFSEVDITLIDRIHSLLNPPSPSNASKRYEETSDRRVSLHCSTGLATLHVRFPIPDLRPGNAVDKFPWWKKTVHREILIVELSEFDFKTNFQDDEPTRTLEFTALDAHALFKESGDPVSFLRASSQEDDSVKLTVKISPTLDTRLAEERSESDESSDDSTYDVTVNPEPTPFSTAKIIHDNAEVIIPGDKQQMDIFREKCVNNTQLLFDIHVPNLNASLPSQKFYELLYNRINGDLLLWVPQAPSPITTQTSSTSMFQPVGLELVNQVFYEFDEYLPCKSGIRYESSSESEDESLGPEHTIYNQDMKRMSGNNLEKAKRGNTQNRICFGLSVGFGKVTVLTPLKDENGKVSETETGELLLEVEGGSLMMVDSARKVTSMSIQAKRAALYHEGSKLIPTEWSDLGRATVAPTDLEATIYKSDQGIQTKSNPNLAMVSIAIRIKPEQLNAVASSKEFLVALGVHGGTLRHRMTESRHSWFTQIMDFLDVKDFPIRGYTLPKVVTVLHCHLWSCAIDYRPLHLPYRCLVSLENFSVSSNIIAKSMTTLLKFIVEDGTLSISSNCKTSGVNVNRDYICVLEVGLFELTLLTSDGRDWKYPRLDLKASNDIIHIRTCSDSCLALKQLILYLTNYGDLVEDSSQPEVEIMLQNWEPETEVDLQHVHDMMADAMQDAAPSGDSLENQNERRPSLGNPTQVFFFPDEASSTPDSQTSDETSAHAPQQPILTVDLDDEDSASCQTGDEDEEVYSGDEDFCIIDDPGLGISPRDGEPTIRILSDDPLVFKDNHFSKPLGRTDLLRAPESFPNAVYRYTLKEMSLVWHMYGGEDFRQGVPQQVTMSGTRVAFGKPAVNEKAKLAWRLRGGPFRDHGTLMQLHLNKIRLQHEVYPETTAQASRQIFLVNELEIRDKLSSSQINKFLYQYTCDQMPRQSRANMILIKNVSLRPDLHLPNTQECSLKVSLLPMRFNIDQDSLMFLRRFMLAIGNDDNEDEEVSRPDRNTVADQASSPPKNQPIMGSPGQKQILHPNHDKVKFDEFSEKESNLDTTPSEIEQNPTYFKTFVFSPDVLIRLDYQGKRVTNMGPGTAGTATGLLAGLAQLNCSEFRLKRIHYRKGLLGVDRVCLHALNEWLNDIKKNQLPSILGGVGPMHTVLQLFQGVKDLFWLPVEQYKKDGRLLRGIQRGANSFTTSTLMAALELTNRTVQSVQYLAEMTYDMVAPNISARRRKQLCGPPRRQPSDFREGVNTAYQVLREGFSDTAQTILQAAQKEHDMRGVTGAVGGVLRQIPPTVVQPLILATEATSNVLGGMRNQLLPDAKREEDEKWKQDVD